MRVWVSDPHRNEDLGCSPGQATKSLFFVPRSALSVKYCAFGLRAHCSNILLMVPHFTLKMGRDYSSNSQAQCCDTLSQSVVKFATARKFYGLHMGYFSGQLEWI